jgi:hypothetical protein
MLFSPNPIEQNHSIGKVSGVRCQIIGLTKFINSNIVTI